MSARLSLQTHLKRPNRRRARQSWRHTTCRCSDGFRCRSERARTRGAYTPLVGKWPTIGGLAPIWRDCWGSRFGSHDQPGVQIRRFIAADVINRTENRLNQSCDALQDEMLPQRPVSCLLGLRTSALPQHNPATEGGDAKLKTAGKKGTEESSRLHHLEKLFFYPVWLQTLPSSECLCASDTTWHFRLLMH